MYPKKAKKTSIKDIAREAGVSPALVSFVLNGKQKQYRVSDQMADKIREIVKKLDYKPNGFAKSLREGTNNTIGVIVSDIANPFFSNMVKSIENAAEESGYMVLFASSDEKSEKLSSLLGKMLSKEVEGVIVVPCEGSEDTIRSLIDKRIPTVLLDRYIPEIRTNYVCLDNKKAGYDATEALIRKNFKKIAMVCYDMKLSNTRDRIAGYMEAMENYGLKEESKVHYINIDTLEKSCVKAIDKTLADKTEAIVCATNSITVTCLRYLQKLHIRIPEDITIMGFDGGNEFGFFNSPISFMMQPTEKIARKSIEVLINQLQNDDGMTIQIEAEGVIQEHLPPTQN